MSADLALITKLNKVTFSNICGGQSLEFGLIQLGRPCRDQEFYRRGLYAITCHFLDCSSIIFEFTVPKLSI